MPRKIPELSNLEIGRIRSNLSRKASQIGKRLQDNATGSLTDNDGNPIEMSASQLKAAELVLKNVLPGQQATTFQDVTEPELTRDEIEGNVQAQLVKALETIPQEERQALIDSIGKQKQ